MAYIIDATATIDEAAAIAAATSTEQRHQY